MKKKQSYCLENNISATIFLIKLINYEKIREDFAAMGAENALFDISTQIAGISKDNDILGYVFDYTFAFFVPFMESGEARLFARNLSDKINSSSHLYKSKNVSTKVQIVHKELAGEDVLEFLYSLDLLFNDRT